MPGLSNGCGGATALDTAGHRVEEDGKGDENWPKVRTYGELAIYIAPHDPEVLNHLGRAQVETGAGDKGLFSYDTMLLTNPRRPGLVHLGRARALLAMGKKAEAKTALTEALKKEPDNAEALELKKQLP